MTNKTVLRITRHELDTDREAFLRNVYGDDVEIITNDIRYGDDPIATVKELIASTETNGRKVVAIEAQAPFPVTMKLVDQRRDLGVALIRAQFERGEDGRAIVVGQDESGRDLLKFAHYEELLRIEFETRRLGPPAKPEPYDPERELQERRDRAYSAMMDLASIDSAELDRLYNCTAW